MFSDDLFFDPEPSHKSRAIDLYALIKDLPIVSPHGHVDPSLFSTPNRTFGNPVELLIQPDHYVCRMLYSQGVPYEFLLSKQESPRRIWQVFAEKFYLFTGTPSGMWLTHSMQNVFGVDEKLTPESAGRIYDRIDNALGLPEFSPRSLFERLNIEILATTDAATDTLPHHQALRTSGWPGRIIPTFRPDALINLLAPDWCSNVGELGAVSGQTVNSYRSYISALEQRRTCFASLGATATDISPASVDSTPLQPAQAEAIFQRALQGAATPEDAARFSANMLFEMARMSTEDGLIMQIHPGVYRNHNRRVLDQFGPDRGFDIPLYIEYTRSLLPLLEQFGNHPRFNVLLFTLDESTYTRELAPLAGAYPAVKLGPPWWFHDSWNGMRRYFDQVMETAGLFNTAGFNDDTRAFTSIPARHDLWRRASANWLAGLWQRGVIDRQDAEMLALELAAGLAKRAYHLE